MASKELNRLKVAIDSARGSPEDLKIVFAEVVDRLGHDEASALWWAAFGAEDASDT